MEKKSVLAALMYIFSNYMQQGLDVDQYSDQLIAELDNAGFHKDIIEDAFGWLLNLAELESGPRITPSASAYRVFSEFEKEYLDVECQRFLIELDGLVSATTRERVIHQLIELQSEGIDVALIKWVALMVLYNMPDEEDSLMRMEFLVLNDEPVDHVH